MTNYLTTSLAASTYQTIANMSNYVLTSTPLNSITIPTGNLDLNNNKITNLTPGTNPNDAVCFS